MFAIEEIKRVVTQSEAAKSEGIGMTDEDKEYVESIMEEIKKTAEQEGVGPDRWLRGYYGRGISLSKYQAILERQLLSNSYRSATIEAFGWTDEDFEAHYTSNRDDFDLVDYHTFTIKGKPDVDNMEDLYAEDDLDAYREAQKKKAEEMLSQVTTSEAFWELSREYDDHVHDEDCDHDEDEYNETDKTLVEGRSTANLSEDIAGFLLDDNRKSGDKAVVESKEDFLVLLFLDRYRDETPFTDEAVRDKAEEIYAEWLDGDADEDSFADLAREHSADGNSAQGGIYEGVTQGQMVETFNDWCFDPDREPGDSGIVETEFGQHIMYFVGVNEEDKDTIDVRHILIRSGGWKTAVKNSMDNEAYAEHYEELTENQVFKTHWLAMRFTKSIAKSSE
jgi:hypothetical protein